MGTLFVTTSYAGLTVGQSTSFAHGLGATPNIMWVQENTTTNSTTAIKLAWKADGTNMSIYNQGQGRAAGINVFAMYAHSIIR